MVTRKWSDLQRSLLMVSLGLLGMKAVGSYLSSFFFFFLQPRPQLATLVLNLVFLENNFIGLDNRHLNQARSQLLSRFHTWVNSQGSILTEISPGISLEGLMLKLKLQYFGHLMRRVDSLEDSDAGRDWGQEERGTTEDEMARWHHWLDGRESEWTPGVGAGQGGLVCCDLWGRKESDMTERLIWSDLKPSRAVLY